MLGLGTFSFLLFALAVGTWRRPAVGIAAVLCLFGLKQWGQSSSAQLAEYRQIANYAVGIIALLGVARVAMLRSCMFCRIPRVFWLIAALYAYALITVSWSPDRGLSLEQWVLAAPYLMTVMVLAPLLTGDLDESRVALLWTMMVGVAICTLALAFGTWGRRGLLLYNDIYRFETNPLALADLGGTVVLIAALSLGRMNSNIIRLIALICIPVAVAVILRSASRGQLLAAGAGLLVAWPIAFPLKSVRSAGALVFGLATVALLGFWASTWFAIDTARWTGAHSEQDVGDRIEMARTLLSTAAASPFTFLFGLGNSSSWHFLGIYPHITGLEVLAEEGILGATMYIAIFVVAFRSINASVASLPTIGLKRTTLATLIGLFVFHLILTWKQGTFLSSMYVFAFAIILGRLRLTQAEEKGADLEHLVHGPASVPSLSNLMR